jgi:hypothetical protein
MGADASDEGTVRTLRASKEEMFAMSVPGMVLLAVVVVALVGAIAWLLPSGQPVDRRPKG